jgi:peptidyl-tRNA hydrolase
MADPELAGPELPLLTSAEAGVRAMPLVLRIERTDPPTCTALLAAAARAVLAVCLDPRAEPGGEWHERLAAWRAGRIRKLARRARGAHWAAVATLPGITVSVDGAEARALVPMPMAQTPPEVRRLQITGTEVPADAPGPPPPGVPVIWLNPGVPMTVGKAAAQVGHAAMLYADAEELDEVPPFAVRTADRLRWRSLLVIANRGDAVAVRDAGLTEIPAGTITCIVP